MRSFTNNSGEVVNVDDNHLKIALKLKIELQKISPSRRVSWKIHKSCMEKEGFFNSDTNENYRTMIKHYQKSIGELPSIAKHVDLIADSKLESLAELVGDMSIEKRENQVVLSQLNKAKREVIDFVLIAKEIKSAFLDIEIPQRQYKMEIIERKSRSMLVLPSDWHIGYMNENYNHEVAKSRIAKYVERLVEYAEIFNINEFHVQHIGDICENIYMHNNSQAFNSEFTFAKQIVKATELLYIMIDELSLHGMVIFHGVVRGNHGRMSKKGETVHNDCAEYIVHEGVKSLIDMSKNNRILVDESGYNIERSMLTIRGKRVKAVHGDNDGQNDAFKIQKHISLENEIIDILALGHFHNYQIKSENHGRMVYGSGCLQGSTEYGKTLKYDNPASQGLIIISEDEVIPINISLE